MTILRGVLACLLVVFSLSVLSPSDLDAADYELYIARGIQKINDERYADALREFKRALNVKPDNAEAIYYSGIAHSRLGEYSRAEKLFLRTINMDSSALNAYLELGRVYYSTGKCDKASSYLSKFISRTDNESARQYAVSLQDNCKVQEAAQGERPYSLNVTAGGQHDSNVILEPSNPPADAAVRDRKEDGRGIAIISADGTVLKAGPARLKAAGLIYNSIHGHLEEYNLQYYRANPSVEVDIYGPVTATAGYVLEYTLLGNDLYSRIHTYQGKVRVKEGKLFSTDAIYEYQDHKYWDSGLFATNSLRNGHKNVVGLKQNFTGKKLSANVYGYADFKRAEVRYWSYDGWKAGARAYYAIIPALQVRVSGEYSERDHKDIFSGYTAKRSDDMQKYGIGFTYKISKVLSVMITDTYTINDSNLVDYDYERNIAGIFLKAGVL